MIPLVLLYHPRTLHERNYRFFYIPYSVLSVALGLDRNSVDVMVLDNNVLQLDEPGDSLPMDERRLLCVGISAMIGHQIRDGLRFAECVRERYPQTPIVWGGALPTMLPRETLGDAHVDLIVRGPGEYAFRALVDHFVNGSDISGVPGVGRVVGDSLDLMPPAELGDLNALPLYRDVYPLIQISDYVRDDEHINTRTVSYHSSQGCPFGCAFCCEPVLWARKWKAMSAGRMLHDIDYLVAEHEINGVKLLDSEFFVDIERAFAFARGLIDRRLGVRWAASGHPMTLSRLSDAEFDLLARSGVARLLIGAESGVREELAFIGKRTSREMILGLAQRCAAYDIVASFTFVTGYPGVPASNIDRTLDFAAQLRSVSSRHEAKVHLYGPYPGTPLYGHAISHGFRPPSTLEEWSYFDYYEIQTPWVPAEYEAKVRVFNESHCPYVHAGSLAPPAGG